MNRGQGTVDRARKKEVGRRMTVRRGKSLPIDATQSGQEMSSVQRGGELWWLVDGPAREGLFLHLAHDPPVKDDVEPYDKQWYYGFDSEGQPCEDQQLHPWSTMDEWRRRWKNVNVHRSLVLYDNAGEETAHGPFLVDIDNSGEDIDDALSVTRRVIDYFEGQGLTELEMRVFFSGRKGFHVEIVPSALGIQSWAGNHGIKCACDACRVRRTMKRCIGETGETNIDPIHEYVRLGGSLNGWIHDDGHLMVRKKKLLPVGDLSSLDTDEMVARSQVEAP